MVFPAINKYTTVDKTVRKYLKSIIEKFIIKLKVNNYDVSLRITT